MSPKTWIKMVYFQRYLKLDILARLESSCIVQCTRVCTERSAERSAERNGVEFAPEFLERERNSLTFFETKNTHILCIRTVYDRYGMH